MARWPAERGTWIMIGLPWAVGAASGLSAASLGRSGLLGAALFCGVMAREPFVWSLWRQVRGLTPHADRRRGVFWGTASLALAAVWWAFTPEQTHRIGLVILAIGAAWESGMRLLRARAWWPGVAGSALVAAGAYLAARGDGPPGRTVLVVAAGLAYASGCAMCAMGVYLSKVPTSRSGAGRGAAALLWGWSFGGAIPLALIGLAAQSLPTSAVAFGMGLLHAEMAHEQPRTLDFRRLGWREALWLATVAGLLLWSTGRDAVHPR